MSLIKSLLKGVDMISPNYSLEKDDSNRHKSVPGAIISILMFAFLATASFIFGVELWNREKPYLTLSKSDKSLSYFSLYKLPIMFSLYTIDGVNVINLDDYIRYEVIEYLGPFSNLSNPNPAVNKGKYHMFKCNLSEEFDFFKDSNFGELGILCTNFSQSSILQNELYSSNSTNYEFLFWKCDSTKRKCADDLEQRWESLIIYFSFIDSDTNMINYTNPVVYNEFNKGASLSKTLQKKISIYFELDEINSDIGWIFEDLQTIEHIKIQKVETEYTVLEIGSTSEIASFMLNNSKQITKSGRSYLKVQELFAKIGGIANALFILFNIIFYHFMRFNYLISIYLTAIAKIQSHKQKYAYLSNSPAAVDVLKNESNLKLNVHNTVAFHSGIENNPHQSMQIKEEVKLPQQLPELINIANFNLKHSNSLNSYFSYLTAHILCKKEEKMVYKSTMAKAKNIMSLGQFVNTALFCINYHLGIEGR